MSAPLTTSNITGIHLKQPFFVLNSESFHTHLAPHNSEVSHFYSFTAGCAQEATIAIPDGCIDLVFDCDDNSSTGQVCGTKISAEPVFFQPGHRYFGLRFLPGMLPEFLSISATEIITHNIDLKEVMVGCESLAEQVLQCQSFSQQVAMMGKFLHKSRFKAASQLTNQVITKIRHHKGNIQVQELERFSGYTIRTLQRLFKNDTGLTPKEFSRVIRCQSAIYTINHSNRSDFSNLAYDLGFYDQSHFLKEFKKLVHITPQEYKNRVKDKKYFERILCH